MIRKKARAKIKFNITDKNMSKEGFEHVQHARPHNISRNWGSQEIKATKLLEKYHNF